MTKSYDDELVCKYAEVRILGKVRGQHIKYGFDCRTYDSLDAIEVAEEICEHIKNGKYQVEGVEWRRK